MYGVNGPTFLPLNPSRVMDFGRWNIGHCGSRSQSGTHHAHANSDLGQQACAMKARWTKPLSRYAAKCRYKMKVTGCCL